MSISCGHCQGRHTSVAEVRACSTGTVLTLAKPLNNSGSVVLDRLRNQHAAVRATGDPTAAFKVQHAQREAEQERAAYQAELEAEAWLAGTPVETNPQTSEDDVKYGPGLVSKPQARFIKDLLDKRQVPEAQADSIRLRLRQGLAQYAASQVISMLKRLPVRPVETSDKESPSSGTAARVTEDGMYRNPETGQVIKVQWNKASGDGRRLYAKVAVILAEAERDANGKIHRPADVEFRYAHGLIHRVRPEWRMTIEEQAEWGRLYGVCCNCHRTLTDETSIALGIGPVCRSKGR